MSDSLSLSSRKHCIELPARLILVGIAVYLLAIADGHFGRLLADSMFQYNHSANLRAGTALFAALHSGLGLSLLVIAVRRGLPLWLNRYLFGIVVLVIGIMYVNGLAVTADKPYATDNAALPMHAAGVLLRGENPYESATVSGALQEFGLPDRYATKLRDGSVWDIYPYPAGSFLSVTPLAALGIKDARPLYLLCLLVMYGALFAMAREEHRVFVLAGILLHHSMSVNFTVGGLPEPLWGLPVFLSWLLRHRTFAAAGLLGYAASVKQLGAFFIPFYVAHQFREKGAIAAAKALAMSTAVFAVMNAPFFLASPQEWLVGVVGLTVVPLPALTVGPAMLVSELWPSAPNQLFTAAALLVLFSALAYYVVRGYRQPQLALVLPLLVLWFSWRSPMNYFYLVPILAMVALQSNDPPEVEEGQSELPTAVAA